MIRSALTLVFLIVMLGGYYYWVRRGDKVSRPTKKINTDEMWAQVYDMDSLNEAKEMQTLLTKNHIPCLIYEQGKKDVYGNSLKSYGLSVPKKSIVFAQELIARSPV